MEWDYGKYGVECISSDHSNQFLISYTGLIQQVESMSVHLRLLTCPPLGPLRTFLVPVMASLRDKIDK